MEVLIMEDNKNFTQKLIELLEIESDDWTRQDSLRAYDYVNGMFYDGELNANKIDKYDFYKALTTITGILLGESMCGNNAVHWEIRSQLIVFCKHLGIIPKNYGCY